MKNFKLGFTLGAAMLAGVGMANAQQVVKVGYPPFGAPIYSLPGATTANYKTFDPPGAKAEGAMIDLAKAVANDTGIQIQFVATVASDGAPSLAANTIDIFLGSQMSPELKATLDITDPIYADSEGLLVKKGDPKEYKSWDDLKGMVVGVLTGGAASDALQKSGLFKEVKFYASGPDAAQAAADGQVSAYFPNSLITATENTRQANPPYGALQVAKSYQPHFSNQISMTMRKGQGDLLKTINRSLAKLKADGKIKGIFAKYGIDFAVAK